MNNIKLIIAAGAMALSVNVHAQTWNVSGGSVTTTTPGNCSIQGGLLDMTTAGGDFVRSINANSLTNVFNIVSGNNGAYIGLNAFNAGDPGAMNFNTTNNGSGFNFIHFSGGMPMQLANLNNSGDLTVSNNHYVQGGLIDMSMTADVVNRVITANSHSNSLYLKSGDGAYISMNALGASDAGAMSFNSFGSGSGFHFFHYNGSGFDQLVSIRNDGTVVMGDASTSVPLTYHYGLIVKDGILTQKLKVANPTDGANWSDFVFNSDYELMPLNKVESFVQANRHLPEIPSAKEVATDGIDVASMDAKLLQKIEELTLYVIAQNKQIDKQQQQINVLMAQKK